MYLDFYGLRERPFTTTADPRFLHLTERHREALAQLTYAVEEDQGFIVLTGPVGTGKTTLLHALLSQLDSTTAAAFIRNSMLPFDGILDYLFDALGAGAVGPSHAQALLALERVLVDRHRTGRKTVLIVDEAQNLSTATLERVRLLSNLEHQGARLLRIVLSGQPELAEKLALPALRQLRQRVALWSRIEPLSPDETHAYVRARLRIAGARDSGIFTNTALREVVRHSGGVPRIVNLLCDHCLLIGYADQRRRVEPDIVAQARTQMNAPPLGRSRRRQQRSRQRWAVGTLAAAAIIAVVGALLRADALQLAEIARSARALFLP